MGLPIKLSIILAGTCVLAACGGGGGGAASLEDQMNTGEELIERFGDADRTAVDDMPMTGTATYDGVAELRTNEASVGADLELVADFEASSVDGTFDNFNDPEGFEIGGSVSVSDGQIVGNSLAGDLDGQLTVEGEDVGVTGAIFGEFVGENAEGIRGELEGTLTNAEGPDEGFVGEFIAAQ
jgi:hypothetical protein